MKMKVLLSIFLIFCTISLFTSEETSSENIDSAPLPENTVDVPENKESEIDIKVDNIEKKEEITENKVTEETISENANEDKQPEVIPQDNEKTTEDKQPEENNEIPKNNEESKETPENNENPTNTEVNNENPENPQNNENSDNFVDNPEISNKPDVTISVEQPQDIEIELPPEKEKAYPGPSEEFIKEWELVMGEFIPEDITTFKMDARSREYFIEDAEIKTSTTNVEIKGAFFIHDENVENFQLIITNPAGEVVKRYDQKKEGIFVVPCTVSGKYTFEFINPSSEELKLTVAAHYFHEEKNVVKNEEINILHEKLKSSLKMMKSMISESKFGDIHRNAHLDVLAKGYKRLFYFTFLESAVILIVTLLQIHFIERLLSHKVSV